MNLAKARDYFSEYYEGSLDRGLKQSFESRLREDAQLQAEYRAFERTMKSLEAFGGVEIEPPSDLHERIAARLDRAIWEQKREKTGRLSVGWWRGLTMLGAAAAILLIVFVGIHNNGEASESNLIGSGSSAESPRFSFSAQGGAVLLSYPKVSHETVVIRSGTKEDSIPLYDQDIESKPFENKGNTPLLYRIEVSGQSDSISFLAIPGHVAQSITAGRGNVLDLATAIAGHYREPVVVQIGDSFIGDLTWNFASGDAVAAAQDSVRTLGLSAQDQNGFIAITKT